MATVSQSVRHELLDILQWAKNRKDLECLHRPDVNIHKRNLLITWNQTIREIERRLDLPSSILDNDVNINRTSDVQAISCPFCAHIFKWIDERLPNYCPECGKQIIHHLGKFKDLHGKT